MIRKTMSIVSILLLAAMLMTACGEAGKPAAEGTTKEPDPVQEAPEETTADAEYHLPELDYGGATFTFLNGMYYDTDTFMLNVPEATGDVVNDAVYERNLAVMSQFNLEFAFIDKCRSTGDPAAAYIRKEVLAGSDAIDAIANVQCDVTPLVTEGMFLNLKDAPYIDLQQPWWAYGFIREMTIGDSSLYFVTGDISLGMIRYQGCVYFAKSLWESLNGDPNDLYALAADGGWTFDRFAGYAEQAYSDLNGNGEADADDRLGTGLVVTSISDHLTYSAGNRATTRGAGDIPVLALDNERMATFTQKMYSLYYENAGAWVCPPVAASLRETIPAKFKTDELLFMPGEFYHCEYLRDMESDYGIIPYPKYDEAQENYLSLVHDIATFFCIPVTCNKFEAVCAVYEALAYEGYRTTAPAYYEVALKTKYVRDSNDLAIRLVDMIHDHSMTDFAYVYNYALNGIGLLMRDLMREGSADLASAYAAKKDAAQVLLDELVALYLKNNGKA